MRAFSTFVWAVLLTAFTAFGQVIRITQFPAAGAVTPISGTVTGLTNPGAFKVILYLQAGGNWWIKPFPGSSVTLSGTGAFTFNNWASYPAGDANFQSLQLYVVPAATAVVNGEFYACFVIQISAKSANVLSLQHSVDPSHKLLCQQA